MSIARAVSYIVLILAMPVLTIIFLNFLNRISDSDLILKPVKVEWLQNKCIAKDDKQIIDCDKAGTFTLEIYMDNKHDSAFREVYQQSDKYLVFIEIDNNKSKMGKSRLYSVSTNSIQKEIIEKDVKVEMDFNKQELEIIDYDLSKFIDTPYPNVKNVKLQGVYNFKLNPLSIP